MLTKQIAQYLHNNGLGVFDETSVNGDIFIEVLPIQPDECVAIFQNAGVPADPRNIYRQPAIQIIVRSINGDPRDALTRAQNIFNALNGINGQTFVVDGYYIVNCVAQQSAPTNIGTDQNNRYEFSFNFLIEHQI